MKNSNTKPPWLVFVERAPDDDPSLQLMVINPMNGQTSTLSDKLIELDPNEPGYRDLPTASA
ncbi:hypothetical protein KKC97_12880 [bacterium]|nr:hypothetical protein [bacterium]MBU1638551.1 hypothetical protein [bacterium]MBU1920101.1 hypothetical protein [bacterium]